MDLTQLTPDEVVLWQWGPFEINATIVFTWGVMAVMIAGAWLLSRRISPSPDVPSGQNAIEVVIDYIRDQIREISGGDEGAQEANCAGVFAENVYEQYRRTDVRNRSCSQSFASCERNPL